MNGFTKTLQSEASNMKEVALAIKVRGAARPPARTPPSSAC